MFSCSVYGCLPKIHNLFQSRFIKMTQICRSAFETDINRSFHVKEVSKLVI